MAQPINITSLKSPKTALVKKALIIATATAGLIAAGALAFVVAQPDEAVEETSD